VVACKHGGKTKKELDLLRKLGGMTLKELKAELN